MAKLKGGYSSDASLVFQPWLKDIRMYVLECCLSQQEVIQMVKDYTLDHAQLEVEYYLGLTSKSKQSFQGLIDHFSLAFQCDCKPIAKWPYTLSLKHYDWVRKEIDKLLKAGVIRKSHSSYSAPVVIIPKSNNEKRICVDFRSLNSIARTCLLPIPKVEDIFTRLGKAKFFTMLDLRAWYHHTALDEDAMEKTAFILPFGKCEYLKVLWVWHRPQHISKI